MATVVALQSFVGILEHDVLGSDRIEKHSEFPNQPSVFPGGLGFPAGSLDRNVVKPGKRIDIVKGQAYESNHPAVLKWPDLFGTSPVAYISVEQATAAPGEKEDARLAGYKFLNTAATTAAVTNRFVASTNMSLTTYTIANASPVWSGGCLVTITHTTVAGADTLGTIVIVGKDPFGATITETLTPVADSTVTSTKIFRSVTSATSVGWVATSTADTIVIGCAAGSYAAIGGGKLHSVILNNSVAAAITISDSSGTIATIPASQAAGSEFLYDVPWSGFLKVATTSTNDVTVITTTGVPSVYAMA